MNTTTYSRLSLRAIALLLTLVMLFAFAACTGGDDPVDTTENPDGGVEETTEEGKIPSNLPATLKFNNQEVRVSISSDERNKNEVGFYEEPVGIINQAIVERNYNVEDRLGIILTFMDQGVLAGPTQVETVRNLILTGGGSNGMDVITGMAYYTSTLASEGLLYNLKSDAEENYMDVTAPWYNQTFVEQCSFQDWLFWSVGDMNVTAYDRTPVTFFNEDALLKWSIEEDLYQTALDGKWTVEKMQTLVKDIHEELDNTEGETKGDFYGLVINGGGMCVDALLVGVGINITTKNENGDHELSWTSGIAQDAFAKLYDLLQTSSGVYLGTTIKEGDTYNGTIAEHYCEDVFYEQRCIFTFGLLSAAQLFATDTSLHYGMLPLPKYVESQKYQTSPHDAYTIVGIAANAGDRLAIASATIECMNESAYYTVRPIYFDMAYKLRYASGENTARLFDTVIDSISFSFGGLYSNTLGDPSHQLRNRLTGAGGIAASNSLTVLKGAFSQALELHLEKLITKFEEMEVGG